MRGGMGGWVAQKNKNDTMMHMQEYWKITDFQTLAKRVELRGF